MKSSVMINVAILYHKKTAHEGVKSPGNMTIRQLQKAILLNTEGQYMKYSNTLAEYVTIKQLKRDIWLNTKGQYIKESNILAGNAINNFLGREILLNTKGQYMNE